MTKATVMSNTSGLNTSRRKSPSRLMAITFITKNRSRGIFLADADQRAEMSSVSCMPRPRKDGAAYDVGDDATMHERADLQIYRDYTNTDPR